MAGNADHRWFMHCAGPNLPNVRGRDIVRAEVNSIGLAGDGDVSSRVDQETSCSATLTNYPNYGLSESLQFASGKIFLSQLNVIHATADGFPDFFQELAAALNFVAGKLGAVGYVVETQACWSDYALGIGFRDLR
jgi:hypothetical protein